MKCAKIKEWLFLEREDDLLTEEQEALLKEHLNKCSGCRELADLLDRQSSFSIRPDEAISPSGEVWQKIKGTLESGPEERFIDVVGDDIKNFFMFRKRVIAAVVVCFLIAGAGITGRMTAVANNAELFLNTQALFMSSFGGEDMFSEATGISTWDI